MWHLILYLFYIAVLGVTITKSQDYTTQSYEQRENMSPRERYEQRQNMSPRERYEQRENMSPRERYEQRQNMSPRERYEQRQNMSPRERYEQRQKYDSEQQYQAKPIITTTITTTTKEPSLIEIAFRKFNITPDVIPIAPPEKLQVLYKNDVNLNFGDLLKPSQIFEAPTLNWTADPNVYYTLCMTNPDAPGHINKPATEFQSWTVVNIPGQDIKRGRTLAEYSGPVHLKDRNSVPQRYVFLIFEQLQMTFFEERPIHAKTTPLERRSNFSTAYFSIKYRLKNPIAGNFFLN